MSQSMSAVKCEFCGRERSFACNNTRDMEDFACGGDRECFFQLQRLWIENDTGGEKSIRYVVLNSPKKAPHEPRREDGDGH